jgi:hypothetical protein
MPREILAPFLRQEKWETDVLVSPIEIDLRYIMLYLQMNGMNGHDIDDDIVTTLHKDAPAYSAVTLWLRQ